MKEKSRFRSGNRRSRITGFVKIHACLRLFCPSPCSLLFHLVSFLLPLLFVSCCLLHCLQSNTIQLSIILVVPIQKPFAPFSALDEPSNRKQVPNDWVNWGSKITKKFILFICIRIHRIIQWQWWWYNVSKGTRAAKFERIFRLLCPRYFWVYFWTERNRNRWIRNARIDGSSKTCSRWQTIERSKDRLLYTHHSSNRGKNFFANLVFPPFLSQHLFSLLGFLLPSRLYCLFSVLVVGTKYWNLRKNLIRFKRNLRQTSDKFMVKWEENDVMKESSFITDRTTMVNERKKVLL